jgi:hypothetical protein
VIGEFRGQAAAQQGVIVGDHDPQGASEDHWRGGAGLGVDGLAGMTVAVGMGQVRGTAGCLPSEFVGGGREVAVGRGGV